MNQAELDAAIEAANRIFSSRYRGSFEPLASAALKPGSEVTDPPQPESPNPFVKQAARSIPAGAVLLAPRYDGVGRPLAAVPSCWCCATPWRLDRLEQWRGKTYAFLAPGCGCLDVPQALACCGLCVEHCRCKKPK